MKKKIFSVWLVLLMVAMVDIVDAQEIIIERDTINNEIITITEKRNEEQEDIKFFFELDKFNFVENFSTNAQQLSRLDQIMADENALVGVDSIMLVAAASIDGNVLHNDYLSKNRAKTIKNLLKTRYSKINPELLRLQNTPEDWVGLRAMIDQDDKVPFKAELLKIIDSDMDADDKEQLIKTLEDRVPWRYLRKYILPKTRYGASVVFFYNINRQKMIEKLRRPRAVYYIQDTIKCCDTLKFIDTVRVDMPTRKFKKNYDNVEILH